MSGPISANLNANSPSLQRRCNELNNEASKTSGRDVKQGSGIDDKLRVGDNAKSVVNTCNDLSNLSSDSEKVVKMISELKSVIFEVRASKL